MLKSSLRASVFALALLPLLFIGRPQRLPVRLAPPRILPSCNFRSVQGVLGQPVTVGAWEVTLSAARAWVGTQPVLVISVQMQSISAKVLALNASVQFVVQGPTGAIPLWYGDPLLPSSAQVGQPISGKLVYATAAQALTVSFYASLPICQVLQTIGRWQVSLS